ncbi:cupin domain-containing protein [Pseudonocardiaceae bacterium YIM PH 21723]|nr:cupin domain-containing protein [Pseudonocardiaceae bacterium YIM PH 21723]
MTDISRRGALGVAAAAAVAAGVNGKIAQAEPAKAAEPQHSHVFKLTSSKPTVFDGGDLRGAHHQNFPVLEGQNGSVYLIRLEVGGIREPHWHPVAWELNFVISGQAKWTMLGTHPSGNYEQDEFIAEAGDLVFAPTGQFHYFENASKTEPLQVLAMFNTSSIEPNDDIGIVGTLNSIPRDVLAATFGVPESAFAAIPKDVKPVVITRRK